MEFTEKTLLKDILREYPALEEKLKRKEELASLLSSPMVKLMMKKATIRDASRFSGVPAEELIKELERIIREL